LEKISLFPIFSLVSGSGSLISTASPISPGPTGFCGGRITFRGSGSFFSSSGFSASSLALSSFYTKEFTELFRKKKIVRVSFVIKNLIFRISGFPGFPGFPGSPGFSCSSGFSRSPGSLGFPGFPVSPVSPGFPCSPGFPPGSLLPSLLGLVPSALVANPSYPSSLSSFYPKTFRKIFFVKRKYFLFFFISLF